MGAVPALNPVSISGVDAGNLKRNILTDTLGRIEINTAQSLPLPIGASTSANQTSGNSSLSSIDSKTPALVSGRQPVVLPLEAATYSANINNLLIALLPTDVFITSSLFIMSIPSI